MTTFQNQSPGGTRQAQIPPRFATPSEFKVQSRSPVKLVALATCCLLLASGSLFGATLYYDPGLASNSDWYGNHWSTSGTPGTYTQAWVAGEDAVFAGSARIVEPSADVSVGNITNSTGGTVQFSRSSGASFDFQLNDSLIDGAIRFSSQLAVMGNFTLTNSGVSTMDGIAAATYAGTATLQSGTLFQVSNGTQLGASSNFVVDGHPRVGFYTTATAGSVTINSGGLEIGIGNTATVQNFSGGGGNLRPRSSSSSNTSTFVVDQSVNTEFAGSITGSLGTGPNRLALTKSGVGNLTLSGTIFGQQKTTTVNGGGLFLTGATTKSFGDVDGTTAIQVNDGGMLGGLGSAITTLDGDHIVIGNGGRLAAGLPGSAGKTEYALGIGSMLDISAATGGSSWLAFELGAPGTPGIDYDQIEVSSGSLAIGSGLLNFSDFDFQGLAGFDQGTYTLFSNQALSGSLASGGLSGSINGLVSTLSLSGNDIILTVVPEPSTGLLVAGGLLFFALRSRRFRSGAAQKTPPGKANPRARCGTHRSVSLRRDGDGLTGKGAP